MPRWYCVFGCFLKFLFTCYSFSLARSLSFSFIQRWFGVFCSRFFALFPFFRCWFSSPKMFSVTPVLVQIQYIFWNTLSISGDVNIAACLPDAWALLISTRITCVHTSVVNNKILTQTQTHMNLHQSAYQLRLSNVKFISVKALIYSNLLHNYYFVCDMHVTQQPPFFHSTQSHHYCFWIACLSLLKERKKKVVWSFAFCLFALWCSAHVCFFLSLSFYHWFNENACFFTFDRKSKSEIFLCFFFLLNLIAYEWDSISKDLSTKLLLNFIAMMRAEWDEWCFHCVLIKPWIWFSFFSYFWLMRQLPWLRRPIIKNDNRIHMREHRQTPLRHAYKTVYILNIRSQKFQIIKQSGECLTMDWNGLDEMRASS